MQSQRKTVRKIALGLAEIILREAWHLGESKVEALGKLAGQGEELLQVGLGHPGIRLASREQGVFVIWAFHVHGKGGWCAARPVGQKLLNHLGAHAVGVDFDGKAQGIQILDQERQAMAFGRLSPGDDQTVKPLPVGLEGLKGVGAVQGGEILVMPGQLAVVASRAA